MRRNLESGLIIPLASLVLGVAVTMLLVLGFESVVVKWAAVELRRNTEELCRFVSEGSILQKEGVLRFRDEVNALELWRTKVTEARLIIPTMSESFGFPSSGASDYVCNGCVPAINGPGVPFSSLGIGNCNLEGGTEGSTDCVFQGDVHPDETLIGSYVPDTLLHNRMDAGVSVVCVVGGNVSLFLSAAKPIRAVTSWWRPVRAGTSKSYVPGAIDQSNFPYRGLTLAISTHLQTDAYDTRYRFSGALDGQSIYEDDFRNRYDPLKDFSAVPGPGLSGFSLHTGEKAYPSVGAATDLVVKPALPDATSRALPIDGYQDHNQSDGSGMVLSDREQVLVSCMNPLVLVRNTFVSTILELASRHGELRNMTEVLHIGTANRTLSDSGDPTSLPELPNSPTVIVPMGADIAKRKYQLPYVFFDTGKSYTGAPAVGLPGTPAEFLPHQNGFIVPFFSAGTNSSRTKQQHSLIAGMLRHCYHLYHGSGLSTGLDRFSITGPYAFLGAALENSGFEPLNVYSRQSELRDVPYALGAGAWDQDYPWSPQSLDCGESPCPGQPSRNLNASEIAAVLGTVQSCPHSASNTCYRPPANFDLSPDMLGLAHYLARSTSITGTEFPALKSPGLFPISSSFDAKLPLKDNASGFNPYIAAENTDSTILIVLHKVPTDSEMQMIKALTTPPARPVTMARSILIVFFPDNGADLGKIDQLKDAFNITDPNDPILSASGNYLRIYSPYLKDYDGWNGTPGFPNFRTGNEGLDHRNYWHYLLTDANENIVNAASEYFYTVLLRLELKF